MDAPSTSKDPRYIERELHGKSEVWKSFNLLFDADSKEYSGFVKCNVCSSELKHHRSLSGTTHLRVHAGKCASQQVQRGKITSFFQPKRVLPKNYKEKLCDAAVAFVAEDIRPMKAVEGSGLHKLVGVCIEIGARVGNIAPSEIMPSRLTVQRRLEQKATDIRGELIGDVLKAMKENGLIGATADMWSDIKSRNFVSITVHFASQAVLNSRVLSVYQFEEEIKSAVNIRKSLENTAEKLGITVENFVNNCIFVTDQGSNIKGALSSYTRLPCACHMLETVLRHTLQLEKLSHTVASMSTDDECMLFVNNLQKSVNAVKNLTAYFKRSGINNNLSTALMQSCTTRWSSTLKMLQSFVRVQAEVIVILRERDEERRLMDVDMSIINALIEFLTPFSDAISYLEGDSYPTIHRVYQWSEKLKRNLRIGAYNMPLLKFLKQRGLICLEKKFEIHDIHRVAFFLNPKFKSLIAFPKEEQDRIKHLANELINKHIPRNENSTHLAPQNIDHNYAPTQPKRSKQSFDDQFIDWQEDIPSREETNEVKDYVEAAFEDEFTNSFLGSDGDFCILKFWASLNVRQKFPNLSRLALGILSVPASSAPSERAFSFCGQTVSKKRASLSASTVDFLAVLNSKAKA